MSDELTPKQRAQVLRDIALICSGGDYEKGLCRRVGNDVRSLHSFDGMTTSESIDNTWKPATWAAIEQYMRSREGALRAVISAACAQFHRIAQQERKQEAEDA